MPCEILMGFTILTALDNNNLIVRTNLTLIFHVFVAKKVIYFNDGMVVNKN